MERHGIDVETRPVPSGRRPAPLSIPRSNTGATNTYHRSYRTPSASLIHSAVRSVLDDATPSTIVSDDQSETSDVDGDIMVTPKYQDSPQLSSLQMEQLPPIPDEQDRKRFIGCLAAVLASAFDYDEVDDETASDPGSASKGSFAYLDYTEDDGGDHDNEIPCAHGRTSLSSSFGNLSETESMRDDGSVKSCTTNHSKSKKGSNATTATSLRPPTWGKRAKERIELAKQRNRRRRYDICCELLVASAELLFLEKGVARGYLPMLSRILVPKRKKTESENVKKREELPPRNSVAMRSAPASPVEKAPSMRKGMSFSPDDIETVELRAETGPPTEALEQKDYGTESLDKDDVLRPFLESMTPGSGFRCLSMLLLQYLLTSQVGYDARIRHVVKKMGVLVLIHDMGNDPVEQELLNGSKDGNSATYKEMLTHATRKFESLESSIARRLIRLSQTRPNQRVKSRTNFGEQCKSQDEGFTREKILRGVKIGSAGIVAGTLFALTGGLAAPGIAAGVAAFAGSSAVVSAAVSVLTSTAIVTTIFGVGGGSLAAYKMQRRTEGLTEFEFRKELVDRIATGRRDSSTTRPEKDAELFTTICISGWLRDKYDYQRPWGLHPTHPRLRDRLELLERFYAVHRPDHVPNCMKILSDWKGEENKLWSILHKKYGRDPDHLFPLQDGPRMRGSLTLDQEETLNAMFVELGYNSVAPKKESTGDRDQRSPLERMREGWQHQNQKLASNRYSNNVDSMHGPSAGMNGFQRNSDFELRKEEFSQNRNIAKTMSDSGEYVPPTHLATVWDYGSTYGGELYTVRWESTLLKTICDCVMDLAMDVVSGATRQILKATILSTLLAAVVLPSYILNLANMIDGEWTLAVERADQAGEELARTLLLSRAGHRPVTLVGFSFGARVIYACLKELAKMQEEWEDLAELKAKTGAHSPEEQRQYTQLAKKFEGMREPSSVVEDAVIMGLPNHLSLSSWKACRMVVAGRLVNCYSTKDLILSLMFQAKRFSPGIQTILKPVCGTCEVNEPGVENIDVSDLVLGHQDYCLQTGKILERVKFGEPLRLKRENDPKGPAVETSQSAAKQLKFSDSI